MAYMKLAEELIMGILNELLGDPSKAKKELGWIPATTLEDLISEMITFDKQEAKKELILKASGIKIDSSYESPPNN